MALTIASLQQFFNSFLQVSKYIVAYSGGLDSTVLLHAMHGLKLPLHAIHVNHHIQNDSDQWQRHCERNCTLLRVPFSVVHAKVEKIPQTSFEESARSVRYQLLGQFVNAQHYLVTAHHKNDLAETLLLQLLRGAGPAGLAAMPKVQNYLSSKHLRPLLAYQRSALLEYARHYCLEWVEDLSNNSMDYDRNYLRKEIMPQLESRWPGVFSTLSRAATLQGDAKHCLQALARLDIQAAQTSYSHILNTKPIQELPRARINNTIRSWIQNHGMRVPNKKLLDHIVTDIVSKETLESFAVQTWAEGEVRRYREQIFLMKPLPKHDATQEFRWNLNQPLYIESLDRTLHSLDLEQQGVAILEGTQELMVRFRAGGERIKPIGDKHHRSLKNLFQGANVPPWERCRVPLLYHENQLISVLGYWNAAILSETSNHE